MREKYAKMTQRQTYEVFRLLTEHVIIQDGFATFSEGWSDERIAEIVDVPITSVSKLRVKEFGKLRLAVTIPTPAADEILAELQNAVKELSVSIAQIRRWIEVMDPDWVQTIFRAKVEK